MDKEHLEPQVNEEEFEQSEELFEHHRLVIEPGQKLMRLDKYLVCRLASTSRNRIQNAAEAGNILVNGKPSKNSYKVKPGDIISIVLSFPKTETELIAQDIPINIVYEDDDFVIVNKNPGMVVHPSFGHYEGTLMNALMFKFQQLPSTPGNEIRPGLLHRIDKDTSGLLVVAKNEIAMNKIAKQFFDHTTKRKYQALVWGNLANDEGTITGHVGRNLKNRKIMDVFPDGEYGKEAITHYKVLERFNYVNLVECQLETGRTHQIRVHFKSIGHPLFNDWEYGGDKILKGTTFNKYKQFVENCFKICPRQALHAKTLGFIHPSTGKEVCFDSDLPEDMQNCINKWREYIS
ncbi:MAG: RluA family pseudouridine synthase [Bacteroidota bacterium]|jgi:23S rRNA pseudouridine1911/1915/1917 synthase|nr:RluA family pseudouridine synthase [Bacteroidales bacterium]MDI9535519.1 RluA family pseudouridine synthase [Bacteroidota bacterium]OQC44222.1 MAG: Ribosomal large subunit pseudouridine synthase D [Bacteroidetes bacterium ADurb.Bin028]NLP20783.1 RluA family pseudouridine synthase [Bacteroidales bacterium]HNY43525.1 RluA family pseudouridine synthase [Bacteroidales bacterium]